MEGTDGAGKSTQATRLAETIRREVGPVVETREPGGTEAGEAVREVLKSGTVRSARAELLLFEACRAELVETVIRPALEAGTHVVSDRFTGSTFAYQGAGRQMGSEMVAAANSLATGGLTADITILLVANDETTRERTNRREGARDHFEAQGTEFTQRVNRGYRERAVAEGWTIIDGGQDADGVSADIWTVVERMMRTRR